MHLYANLRITIEEIDMKKQAKKKIKYSTFSNLIYLIKLQFSLKKSSILLIALNIPITVLLSYCSIYIPKLIVQNVIQPEATCWSVLEPVIFISIFVFVLKVTSQIISTINFALLTQYNNSVTDIKNRKCLMTDYENLESPEFRLLMERAAESLWGSNNGAAIEQMVQIFSNLICSILSYILFGSILSFANPLIVILLTLIPLINYFTIRSIQKFQYSSKDETTLLDKKMWYIASNAENFKTAKDIRIFGLNEWLVNMFKSFAKERLSWSNKIAKREYAADIVNGLIILVRDGLAYAVLIIMVCNGEITIDDFVLYFAAVGSFTSSIGGIVGQFSALNSTSLLINDLREFMNYPEKKDSGTKMMNVMKPGSIKLDKITFNYPGAQTPTLKNISLNISAGERIAIVGLNGAGKTTLIKIICGLYRPTAGNVYIDNVKYDRFDKSDYYSLFSVVFQDYSFLPVSLAEIVSAFSKPIDEEKVIRCIKMAGLYEKIAKFPEGINTKLNKQINECGVELSGGEYQKLLLARALYKNGPFLILDEPTSAMDPISEKEFYQKYDELFEDKTAIFISHSLATTAFCDRIVYLKNGEICECGTHEELLKLNGEYAKIYNMQKGQYVKKENECNAN